MLRLHNIEREGVNCKIKHPQCNSKYTKNKKKLQLLYPLTFESDA